MGVKGEKGDVCNAVSYEFIKFNSIMKIISFTGKRRKRFKGKKKFLNKIEFKSNSLNL